MEIKNIEKTTVLTKTVKTTLRNIAQYVGNEPAKLVEQAQRAGLEICGPQVWEYVDGDGKPDTEFTLHINIPVKSNGKNPENMRELMPFTCAMMMHMGSWDNFRVTYEKLVGDIMQGGYKMTG
ncbi:MAG: hypothetical protein JXB49_19585 [Bacteroidales bacterium]|nr:hypothetical protein [Bacteroidales bacterium]